VSASPLAEVVPGFAAPVLDSQHAFRGCLDALAHPGRVIELGAALQAITGLHPASAALMLALLDQDTRLWLSPGLAHGAAAASLRFHTGCPLVGLPQEADFALANDPAELPPLEAFGIGTDEYPERSATVVLQVAALVPAGWRLTGPGIRGQTRLSAPPLGEDFLLQWERNHARFPRGVDLFLTSEDRLCGLPRSTRLEN
jgi:alpha-D-ribose 1-methylphosphonate 5-triphosphate synthase subunit PhnH